MKLNSDEIKIAPHDEHHDNNEFKMEIDLKHFLEVSAVVWSIELDG